MDISRAAFTKEERLKVCVHRCQLFAADLIHGHLLRNADLKALSRTGIPIISTVHNTKSGWPDPLSELSPEVVSLLIACSLAVEQEAATAGHEIPVRTIWNGIQPIRSPKGSEKDENEIVLVAVANPRPQKRLERLPSVAASLQRLIHADGSPRNVRLLIAGEASRENEQARESVNKLHEAITANEMDSQVELLGPVSDVATLLSRADVLLSAAAHEGLSLAHLEALSANVPVVATDVGGTREIAARCPGLKLVGAEASPDEFASAVLDIASSQLPPFLENIERHFSSRVMTQSYSKNLSPYTRVTIAQNRLRSLAHYQQLLNWRRSNECQKIVNRLAFERYQRPRRSTSRVQSIPNARPPSTVSRWNRCLGSSLRRQNRSACRDSTALAIH